MHPAAGAPRPVRSVNALIAHCGESLSGIGGVRRPGIVHRLDKDTSGLLVVAKTDAAHKALAAQFADHRPHGPARARVRRAGLGRSVADPTARWTRRSGAARPTARRWRWCPSPRAARRSRIWEVAQAYERGPRARPPPSPTKGALCAGDRGARTRSACTWLISAIRLLGDGLYAKGFKTKAARLSEEARGALEGPRPAGAARRRARLRASPHGGDDADSRRDPPAGHGAGSSRRWEGRLHARALRRAEA